MSITITAGWWLLPAAITFAAYLAGFMTCRDEPETLGGGVVGLVVYGCATIVSLVAWLVWSLLT